MVEIGKEKGYLRITKPTLFSTLKCDLHGKMKITFPLITEHSVDED